VSLEYSQISRHTFSELLFSGCWISDPLNKHLGRRGAIFVAALILIATPIASGFSHSWQTLFVIRLVLGIGMGAKGRHDLPVDVFLPC
jgi:MFS family permease